MSIETTPTDVHLVVFQMKLEEYLNHVQQFCVTADRHSQWMAKTIGIINQLDDASMILETVSQQVAECKVYT
jgi:hypothetical protein